MKKILALIVFAIAGCASGPALVPGQSTVADVEAKHPAEKRVVGEETVYYFPELPWGYRSYAARVGADGRLIAVEQRLTEENLKKVVRGKTTGDEVRDLLGPPWEPIHYARMERDVWTYPMRIPADPTPKWFVVQVAADGIVRETFLFDDMNYNRWGGGRRR
jgi:predicted small lipoprotein YifL